VSGRGAPRQFHSKEHSLFFRLSTLELALILVVILFGATFAGLAAARIFHDRAEPLRESMGVLQGALLGLVALLLAFGLSLAVGRYQSRRDAVVSEANAIGTTYLRAQTLNEPGRTPSLDLLRRYTSASILLSHAIPGSSKAKADAAAEDVIQRQLWRLGAHELTASPDASAPRLYIETLNEMIDAQSVRIAALNNRVPNAVLSLELGGAAIALALLAFYLAILHRSTAPVLLAAALVTLLLLVTFDLDRPTRGFITIPDTPLTSLRASMALPPAAPAPTRP
jgi:hypothetical protein